MTAAIVVLTVSMGMGLVWFFADPLHVPEDVLEVLDQRASVIGMFSSMLMGAAGLVVAMLGLRPELRSRPVDDIASTTGTPGPGQAEPAHAHGPRRRTVLLIAAVPAVVVALIVLAAIRDSTPIRYEAEDGIAHKARVVQPVIGASNNASMGYLNFPDSWVEIRVKAPRTDTFTAHVQYSAGDGDARQIVTVNNSTEYVVLYTAYGWKTFRQVSFELRLVKGWNTLRFQHDDGRFAAELDYVEIA